MTFYNSPSAQILSTCEAYQWLPYDLVHHSLVNFPVEIPMNINKNLQTVHLVKMKVISLAQ